MHLLNVGHFDVAEQDQLFSVSFPDVGQLGIAVRWWLDRVNGIRAHADDVVEDVAYPAMTMNARQAAVLLDRADHRRDVADDVFVEQTRRQVRFGGILGPVNPPQPAGEFARHAGGPRVDRPAPASPIADETADSR